MNGCPSPLRTRAFRLLVVLLGIDVFFIALHLVHSLPATKEALPVLKDPLFSLSEDLGLAEFFQYIKEGWIAAILAWLAVRKRSPVFMSWALLFAFFLVDDSLQVHETAGLWLAERYEYVPALGLRMEDFGELSALAVFGAVFAVLIGVNHVRGPAECRRPSKILVALVAALLLFGIVVDLVHMMVHGGPKIIYYGFGMAEDGGEMLVISVICWYVFSVATREQNAHDRGEETGLPA